MENNEKDMIQEKETEVIEDAVETVEETVEEVAEAAVEAAETVEEAEEAIEETAEAAEETVAEAAETAEEAVAPAMKASTAAKREKKQARREAKAERKAANKVEEKKSRPNNLLLAVLILGILLIMFLGVKGYQYFSLSPSIEKYIEKDGGEEKYGSMMIDQYTTAAITAEGNSLKIVLESKASDEEVEALKEYYSGDEWKKQLEYIGAYFLTTLKANARGFSGDVTISSQLNGEEVNSATLTLKEAKKALEPEEEDTDAEEADDSGTAEDADAEEPEGEGDGE